MAVTAGPRPPPPLHQRHQRRGSLLQRRPHPTVTFGDLYRTALPVPAGGEQPVPARRGQDGARGVRSIADPAYHGGTFTAEQLGADDAVPVWRRATTWWNRPVAAAGKALENTLK